MAQPEEQPTSNDEPPTIRLAHLSDVHFGKISHPAIVAALVEEVNAAEMDLVVVSGDLTQRAHDWQFEEARAMLDAFNAPVLVVPGNHDVRQFWHNPVERVVNPTIRFERWITKDLTPTFSASGLSVFGMNTAHGLTAKGGLVRAESLEVMKAYFGGQREGTFRILVAHHHLLKNKSAFGRTDVAIGSRRVIEAAAASCVDLILCGHYHISNVSAYQTGTEHQMIVASAGTATSSRGRGAHKAINMYNWITKESANLAIIERKYDPAQMRFSPERRSSFAITG